jgi:hypothetical protein
MPPTKTGPGPSSAIRSRSTFTCSSWLDEKPGLVRLALPEHVVAGDAKSVRHQRVAKRQPQLDVLGQAVDQHAGRPILRAV